MNARKQKEMEKLPHISSGYDDTLTFVSNSAIISILFVYFSVMFLSLSTAFYTNTICTVNFSLFTI